MTPKTYHEISWDYRFKYAKWTTVVNVHWCRFGHLFADDAQAFKFLTFQEDPHLVELAPLSTVEFR
jgi:hypothetical protein